MAGTVKAGTSNGRIVAMEQIPRTMRAVAYRKSVPAADLNECGLRGLVTQDCGR